MSMLVRFTPASPTSRAQYDETITKLEGDGGQWPPDGCDYHVCFMVDGELRVNEIWDSREQFEKFGERLMPVLAEVGIEPGDPEILEVHNTIRR
jgi:hypothetical protein